MFAQLVDPIAASIKDSIDDIVMVKDVWDTSMLCELQFVEWRNTLWNDIRTEVMEDGAKGFVKVRRSRLLLFKSLGLSVLNPPFHSPPLSFILFLSTMHRM